MAAVASTALPPFWKIIAPASALSGLPVMAIQWRPCSGGFCVRTGRPSRGCVVRVGVSSCANAGVVMDRASSAAAANVNERDDMNDVLRLHPFGLPPAALEQRG